MAINSPHKTPGVLYSSCRHLKELIEVVLQIIICEVPPHKIRELRLHRRDSSVGRASDWRSEGPWFNPGSRQIFKMPRIEPETYESERNTKNRRLASLQCFPAFSAKWSKLENPGIDPGASRMQIERSTTWANPPCKKRFSLATKSHEYQIHAVSIGDQIR